MPTAPPKSQMALHLFGSALFGKSPPQPIKKLPSFLPLLPSSPLPPCSLSVDQTCVYAETCIAPSLFTWALLQPITVITLCSFVTQDRPSPPWSSKHTDKHPASQAPQRQHNSQCIVSLRVGSGPSTNSKDCDTQVCIEDMFTLPEYTATTHPPSG